MQFNLRWVVALASVFWLASPALFADSNPPTKKSLEDTLEPLSPKQSRSEEDEDRLDSIAHFSAGRMLQQRQQLKPALREYERALRYDAAAGPVLRELVPLAFAANRNEEGLRYLTKYADESPIEPDILQQAAEFLAESGDWKGAIKLDEHVAEQLKSDKPSAQQILLNLQLGRLYALDEQYDAAATQLAHVLDALENPDKFDLDAKLQKNLLGEGGATYALMGAVFLEAKRIDLARKAFQQFNSITPDAALFALNLARVDSAADKPQQALDQLQKYFAAPSSAKQSGDKASADSKPATEAGSGEQDHKPTDGPEAAAMLGKGIAPYELLKDILKQLKQDDQLLTRLEAMHQAQPNNAMLADFLGKQYLDAEKLERAQALIESAHTLQPTVQSYRWLTEIYRKTNQPDKLLKLLGQLIEKSDSLAVVSEEAKSIAGDEKLTAALIATAQQKYAAATEANYFPLRAAATIAAEAKRWKDADALFELAVKAQPKASPELLKFWGLALFIDEKYPEAAKIFQRGLENENASADELASFNFYLAGALEMQNKTDEALAAAKIAVDKEPKNPEIASRPAWILYHAKRYKEASKAYQALLEQFDDDFATDGARDLVREARSALSNLYVLQNDNPRAVEALEQVLDEFPDDAGANNDLGYLWADGNQHLHRAEHMIQLAVDSEPENYAYRDSLGWVLHRRGRDGEALVQLQKAVEPAKPEGEVLDHLGEVQAALGHHAEAQTAWKQSAEAFQKAGENEKMKAVQKKAAEAPK